MEKVTVIDSIMGSGKTSWAIRYMNESPPDKRFIYITPYLNEVERIQKSVTGREFIAPDNRNSEGKKLRSLKALIAAGKNIASTHSLFQTADDEVIELLTGAGYTLILDEVMDVIERAKIGPRDIQAALSRFAKIEDNRVVWTDDDYDDDRFYDIMLLSKAGNLFYHRDRFLIWTFPPRVFKAFDEVTVMTYLFDAQLQRYYYDMHGISYEYKSVKQTGDRFELVPYDRQNEGRQEVMRLIDVYEGSMNDVGSLMTAFSVSWLRSTATETLLQVKRNIYNYFRNVCKAKADEIVWTTKQDYEHQLKGRGYANSFIACNLRATNEYADRWALAYAFNRYMNPFERSFFEDHGVTVNQDLLAVSDLLQWIWRSRIRNGQPVKLYLPSSRMRALLLAWSRYEI